MERKLKTVFITGTDTGVGKTVVATLVISALRHRGFSVGVMKPFETGCIPVEGEKPYASDAELLRKAAQTEELISDMALCPFRYTLPMAPQAAAEKEAATVDLRFIVETVKGLEEHFDFVCIEGAGGLLVPVDRGVLIRDLVERLDATLLIVGHAGLGTINHCLLTVHAASAHAIAVLGIVLNNTADIQVEKDPSLEDNVRLISYYSGVPVWGPLPHDETLASGKILPWKSHLLSKAILPLVDALVMTSPS